jgi:hypothetical protein
MLSGYWRDPDLDTTERALYYDRILEISTPGSTIYDSGYFGVDLPEGVPASQQERADTSPIWYTP